MNDDSLLTFDEALQVLGTSRPTLYRLLSSGEVRGLKVGKQWRFRQPDLVAYMERGPIAAVSAPEMELDQELAFFAAQAERDIQGGTQEEKILELVHNLLRDAIARYASDIHLEACVLDGEPGVLVRYRIDGVLQEIRRIPSALEDAVIARFKVMADMNVGEKQLPQDGRIPLKLSDKNYDLRVAVTPVVSGEAMTIRILDRSNVLIGLDKLTLLPDSLEQVQRLIRQPNGFVVVSGPSGSGKTTTAYSCLAAGADAARKTIAIEEPVEATLDYVTQIPTNRRVGLTFPNALRSILRQDPDVIFSGETRELETLQLELEASLTGHLVLTTLHAGDAPSTISRLMNMGAAGHVLSSSLTGVIAQRLARKICENCREEIDVTSFVQFDTWRRLAASGGYDLPADSRFYRGRGCDHCRGRGYRGRIGLFEILEVTEPLSGAISRGADEEEIARIALECGMRTLWADGLRKAVAGLTTVDELHRVIFTVL